MSEIINYTIVCHKCSHHNKFKVKGEHITTVGGDTFPVLKEKDKDRICEKCGVLLK